MAIMGQIMGRSFGRNPAGFNFGGGPVMHPMGGPMQMPQMYAAPMRPQLPTSVSSQGNPNAPSPDPNRPGGDAWDYIARLRNRNAAGGVVNNSPAAPSVASGTSAGADNGIMQQIMNAFNGGYGGGMDMSKLMQLAPMIMGA